MREHVQEIAREQIAAESEILCGTDEVCNALRLNFGIIGIPFKEAENRILIQGV